MNTITPIQKAIDIVGLQPLADACGLTSYQAVLKWKRVGLPRTEWTGETHYAATIEAATDSQVTRDELLAWSKQMRQQRKKPTPPPPPPDRRTAPDRRQSANRRAEESPGRRAADDRRQSENCREETDAA